MTVDKRTAIYLLLCGVLLGCVLSYLVYRMQWQTLFTLPLFVGAFVGALRLPALARDFKEFIEYKKRRGTDADTADTVIVDSESVEARRRH